ncbi:MAG: TonB-dependent receptor [Saprospiraceae bacterium]|nr:TonB-dependent receptor [Saprospiraceae bacterium]
MPTTALIMKKFASCKTALFFPFLCCFLSLSAQETAPEKNVALPPATIRDVRFERTGYTVRNSDSLPVQGILILSDRLRWENAVDVRANAPGTLATLSIRGAGPNRTPVYWNGVNLQSPMNGVVDAALLPIWPDDKVEIHFGGQSAALSSGAMGGSLHIEQGRQALRSGWSGEIHGATGSFSHHSMRAGAGFAGPRFVGSVRGAYRNALNNFTYPVRGLDGNLYKVRQVNNAAEELDIQQFNQLIINSKNTLKTACWFQNVFREIPPANTEAPRNSWQRDRAHRGILQWEYTPNRRARWTHRLAGLDDYLAFHLSGDTDTSHSRQLLFQSEFSNVAGRSFAWRTGVNALRQWAQADGYSDSTRWFGQTRLSSFAMGEWRLKRFQFSTVLRQEWAEKQASPFTWSVGGRWKGGRAGEGRFHISRNFNLPTFNDRFWQTLGNPDLLPEKGYSADIGWKFQKTDYSIEITGFHLILDDWILWQPDASGLFRPGNLRKVWSRGIELNAFGRKKAGRWTFQVSGRAQGSATTLEAVYSGATNQLGQQLPYTPRFSGGLQLRAQRGIVTAAYSQQFTGKRFDQHAQVLRSFQTGHLFVTCQCWKGRLLLDARIENIWNTRYEIIRYRQMPGRSAGIGVTFRW